MFYLYIMHVHTTGMQYLFQCCLISYSRHCYYWQRQCWPDWWVTYIITCITSVTNDSNVSPAIDIVEGLWELLDLKNNNSGLTQDPFLKWCILLLSLKKSFIRFVYLSQLSFLYVFFSRRTWCKHRNPEIRRGLLQKPFWYVRHNQQMLSLHEKHSLWWLYNNKLIINNIGANPGKLSQNNLFIYKRNLIKNLKNIQPFVCCKTDRFRSFLLLILYIWSLSV